ncbi:MAG: helix-turn-helix domain-containing protein [Bacteroidota bacterium]
MTLQIQASSILFLLGGIQVWFIILYLFLRKNNRPRISLYLSLIILGLFCTLYDYFILRNQLQEEVGYFLLLSYMFQLVYAPASYLLIRAIVFPQENFRQKDLLHFLPAFIHIGVGLFSYHFQPLSYKEAYINQLIDQSGPDQWEANPAFLFFNFLFVVQVLLYLYYAFHLKNNYGAASSLKNPLSLAKLNRFFYSLAGIIVLLLLVNLNLRFLVFSISGIDIGLWILVLISLYLFYLAYFVVLNPEVFEKAVLKYQTSRLPDQEKAQALLALKTHMNKEKPFLRESLSIKELAAEVDMPPRQLSQLINEAFGQNFYEFVNSYRVREAERLFKEGLGQKLSVSGIAYEVGFSSKSSFYTAFKKMTGSTPAAYRKMLESQEN